MSVLAMFTRLTCVLLALRAGLAVEPIVIDGSSTVYPIAVAIGEAYSAKSTVPIQIAVSGTTGGMRLFANGKVPLVGASRPIRPDEVKACAEHGIDFIEIPVALDGLTVAVGTQNTFINHLTVAELKRLWQPGSDVRTWAQLRAGWPDSPVALFGPGQDSGTFDFFTEVVVGEARAIREGFTSSEDDNVLIQGLVVNPNALGYFGWSYFQQNRGMLRAVAVDDGGGPQTPTRELIASGKYSPLSRPLFFYVSNAALERSEIRDFLTLALASTELIEGAGYVPLSDALYTAARERLASRRTGTVFAGKSPSAALAAFAGTKTAKPTPAAKPAAPAAADKPAAKPVAPTAPIARPAAVAVGATTVVAAATPAAPATPAAAPAAPARRALLAAPAPSPAAVSAVSAVPAVAPVAAAASAAVARAEASPVQLERLRAASLALARATLERAPDPADLERRAAALREAIAALPGHATAAGTP